MKRHIRSCRIVLATMLGLLTASAAQAQRRPIAETDLFKFVWVADPQIAPDGTQVAFVRVSVDDKKDGYNTAIWLARTDGSEPARPLTSGVRDTAPRWSPEGRRLVFLRASEKDGRIQPPQIHLLSMSGGEPWAITDMPRGASNPEWAPDGRTIAFTSTARPSELEPQKPAGEKPRESDVRVITDAVYRANGVAGSGYVESGRPSHIWTVAVPASATERAAPKAITSGEFGVGNIRWAPDGSRIFFVSNRRREAYYYPRDSDVYAVSTAPTAKAGEEPSRVVSIEGSIGAYTVAPDGKRVAFVGVPAGNPERSYSQPDLWVADLSGGPARNLTSGYDFDINGGVGGDQRAPRGQLPSGPVWSRDGRSIIVGVGEQGSANLKRVDVATGRVEPITTGNQDVMSYTADAAGQRIALVLSTPTTVADLRILDLSSSSSSAPRKLTTFNDDLFGQLTMNDPEEMWYASFDGRKIQG